MAIDFLREEVEDNTSLQDIIDIIRAEYGFKEPLLIMYRTEFKWSPTGEIEDCLFGYCEYNNGKLKSLDGDTYYLHDKIIKYEITPITKDVDESINPFYLTVWMRSGWISQYK